MDHTVASLHQIETELKKRWLYPYHWHKKQDNQADKLTNFMFDFLYFEDFLTEIDNQLAYRYDYAKLKDYAMNRWYNYWSAIAIERILVSFQGIEAHPNEKHKTIDFYLEGIPFDHKSTVFPQQYPESLSFAQENPTHLMHWLYNAQSEEQRWHLANRLFLVFHDSQGYHWKLKAEISFIKEALTQYIQNFRFSQLKQIAILDTLIWTDIIWITR
jgi:hypothetical protein